VKHTEVTVRIVNHGCKLNQFEGEALGGCLEKSGFRVVEGKKGLRSVVTIINTCTVTGKSDRKSRNTILGAAQSKKQGDILIVTGCYAETDADALAGIRGVDLVIGNRGKASIPGIVTSLLDGVSPAENGVEALRGADRGSFEFEDPLNPRRSRVYVKVQDGCGTGCAYCKVPLARGGSRSRDFDEILRYVRKVVECGFMEVVLTGVNLGDYRHEGGRLPGLLAALLELPGAFRIRLSSIEPMHFDDELIDLVSRPRIAPHFHIPLQSGSDRILRLMGRPYQAEGFFAIADRIVRLRPESHIATDLIVGFPGEGEEDFNATVRAVERVGFASIHVFKYSPRKGTRAAELGDGVPYPVKEARSARLIGMRDGMNELFRRRFVGTVREAVLERKGRELFGITDNYIRVNVSVNARAGTDPGSSGPALERQMRPVRIVEASAARTRGVLL
jgi:threonylcarbamoyladenosine tRNA methylthiotransferase MtaB